MGGLAKGESGCYFARRLLSRKTRSALRVPAAAAAQLRPRYVALLQRVATMLEHRGVVTHLKSSPALIGASGAEASDEDEIRLFDQVSEALGEGLRLLSAQGFSRTDLHEITQATCLLEHTGDKLSTRRS